MYAQCTFHNSPTHIRKHSICGYILPMHTYMSQVAFPEYRLNPVSIRLSTRQIYSCNNRQHQLKVHRISNFMSNRFKLCRFFCYAPKQTEAGIVAIDAVHNFIHIWNSLLLNRIDAQSTNIKCIVTYTEEFFDGNIIEKHRTSM